MFSTVVKKIVLKVQLRVGLLHFLCVKILRHSFFALLWPPALAEEDVRTSQLKASEECERTSSSLGRLKFYHK